MVREQLAHIEENIARICQKCGRDPKEITLVGVTKFATAEKIMEAVAAGISHIGENKVQQAQKKFPVLDSLEGKPAKVTKHMIGHLQTNKVKTALKIFDVLHAVDSLKLAQEVERQAATLERQVDILVHVNCSGEAQKHGIAESEALPVIQEISQLEHINILGLMTMAPFESEPDVIRQCFCDLRQIQDLVKEKLKDKHHVQMKYLSMGMTHDYEIALEEGANMLRIGRAIFGDRD